MKRPIALVLFASILLVGLAASWTSTRGAGEQQTIIEFPEYLCIELRALDEFQADIPSGPMRPAAGATTDGILLELTQRIALHTEALSRAATLDIWITDVRVQNPNFRCYQD